MSYEEGCRAALIHLGFIKVSYDLNDAQSVLQAAKKYTLPKASKNLIPGLTGAHAVAGQVGPFAVPNSRMMNNIANATERFADKLPTVGPDVRAHAQAMRSSADPSLIALKSLNPQGRPAITPGESNPLKYLKNPVTQEVAKTEKFAPDQYKMLHSVLRGHELDEIQAGANPLQSFRGYGHLSPDVMMREHNRITTLPSGFSPVKTVMQNAREHMENAALKNEIPGFEYGNSPRLNRHERRHYGRLMENSAAKKTEDMAEQARVWQKALAELPSIEDGSIQFEG